MRPATTSIRKWWNKKNDLFSVVCSTDKSETFTNGEVVIAHLFIVAVVIIIGLAGSLEGGGL